MSTNCVLPPEPDDIQLLAYLDNPQANQETAQHLQMCPYCRQRAENLNRYQKRLATKLYRITCPSPMELGEYHLRTLTAPQRLVVAQHLRECPHCMQEISRLEEFMSELTPRSDVLDTAKIRFARLVSGGTQTGFPQASPALRGVSKPLPIFEAGGVVISLDLQQGPHGEISILGQMAADDQDQWTGATVELKQAYLMPVYTSIDDLGAFKFDAVDPGSTQMTITSPDGMVIQTETVFISI